MHTTPTAYAARAIARPAGKIIRCVQAWIDARLQPCPGFVHYEGVKGVTGGFYSIPACGQHIGAPHGGKAVYLSCAMSQKRCHRCAGFQAYWQALTARKLGDELDVAVGATHEKSVVRQRDRESAEVDHIDAQPAAAVIKIGLSRFDNKTQPVLVHVAPSVHHTQHRTDQRDRKCDALKNHWVHTASLICGAANYAGGAA